MREVPVRAYHREILGNSLTNKQMVERVFVGIQQISH